MKAHSGPTPVPPIAPALIEPRPSARLSLRLTQAQQQALKELAAQHGASVSAVARGALAAGLSALGSR